MKNNILNGIGSSDYSKIEEKGKEKMAKAVKKNEVMVVAKKRIIISNERIPLRTVWRKR